MDKTINEAPFVASTAMSSLIMLRTRTLTLGVIGAVVIIIAIFSGTYYYHSGSGVTAIATTTILSGTQFDIIGTFSIVYVPCAANVQCNPQYQLAATDGNSYQLIFVSIPPECSVGCLPNQGERIEVIGTFSPYDGNCFLNGQPTPCQPIGKVIVSSWNPGKLPPPITNSISLQDVGLCASICIYPSPYLSGIILVNASVSLSTLHLFINGTDEGTIGLPNATTSYAANLLRTSYAFVFRTQPNNPAMPTIAGDAYMITVVAGFQDNSTCTVSTTVVANSGTGLTTMNP